MNPEVQALIQRALTNDIPMDAFLARMSQLGIPPGQAQTALIKASGGASQGIDPSLSVEQQPIDQSSVAAQMPPSSGKTKPATVATQDYAPPVSLLEKAQRAISVSPEKLNALPSAAGQAQGFGGVPLAATGAQDGVPVPASLPQPQAQPQTASPTVVPAMSDGREPVPPPQASAVQKAVQMSKDRNASQQAAAAQTPAAPPSDLLHTLIRGRFGEAAKGNPMDDRLTPAQEARDRSGDGRASGGAVGGKDAALHKALEIIHHLITTR